MEIINLLLQLIVSGGVLFVMQTKFKDDNLFARTMCGIIFFLIVASALLCKLAVANILFTIGVAIWFIFNIVLYNIRVPKEENRSVSNNRVVN